MSKFDPLKNLRTSRVFFELLDKPKAVTEIATTFQVRPQSIFEHIVRLKTINVVEPGKRQGRFQEYKIDWTSFCYLFLQRAPRTTKLRNRVEKRRLDQNKAFRTLIRRYLETVRVSKDVTLLQTMQEFEEALIRVFPMIKDKTPSIDKETSSLLEALEEWYNYAKDSYTLSQSALSQALKGLNLIKSREQ